MGRPGTCGFVLWKCVTEARFAKAGMRVIPWGPEWKVTPKLAVMSMIKSMIEVS